MVCDDGRGAYVRCPNGTVCGPDGRYMTVYFTLTQAGESVRHRCRFTHELMTDGGVPEAVTFALQDGDAEPPHAQEPTADPMHRLPPAVKPAPQIQAVPPTPAASAELPPQGIGTGTLVPKALPRGPSPLLDGSPDVIDVTDVWPVAPQGCGSGAPVPIEMCPLRRPIAKPKAKAPPSPAAVQLPAAADHLKPLTDSLDVETRAALAERLMFQAIEASFGKAPPPGCGGAAPSSKATPPAYRAPTPCLPGAGSSSDDDLNPFAGLHGWRTWTAT